MLTAWMTAIAGVIALGILLEILLPEGQTAKYVKGAFSLLVVFVIVSPLPSVFGALKEWQPAYSDIAPDYGFLEDAAGMFAQASEERLHEVLTEEGYENEVHVVINGSSLSDFDEINITLRLPVLAEEERHKHISEVTETAVRTLGADAGCVSVVIVERETGYGSS